MASHLIFSSSLPSGIKALIFDLMGTCTDWHSSILPALSSAPPSPLIPPSSLSKFAINWREGFFKEIHARFEAGEEQEDIDATHRRVLDQLLEERGVGLDVWDDGIRENLVRQWHLQVGWPDSIPALTRLREKFFLVVLANGTTRLQLDIAQSSGLPFHALFSSQLLKLTKPDPEIYRKATDLMQLKPEECIMVAAHAYDLRAAKKVGMRTIYVQRKTEDLDEDMSKVREEVDLFIDGRDTEPKAESQVALGLGQLADILCA